MARRDDVDPGLPIKLNPCSNGEFVPGPPGPVAAEAMRRARAEAAIRARRLGMSRGRFLLSHLLDYELVPEGPDFWSGFPYKNCGEAEQRDCFGVDHWLEELFVRSDTAMVVLSAVPIVGDAALDGMRELHSSHPIAAWKVYTHAPGPGWSFVDDTGEAFLSTVEEIAAGGGTRIASVHKGLSGGAS